MTNAPTLPPAPGTSQHVALDLVNSAVTLAGGRHVDLLDTPEAATRWLVERELVPVDAKLWDVCVSRLVRLRDAVRALLEIRTTGRSPSEQALRDVNEALTVAPTALLLHWDERQGLHKAAVHPATQVTEHALAAIAADAVDLLTGNDAERLARCDSTPCDRYLLRTHARRHWCSTRCGDRARAARAYARRTDSATG
ncbi:CGNR zinc finger domain-containing protein [Saccharothrix deserti]|uniref:CGNR zinc finger domain-containing protein n=1 Tax=Saccharothrix deserti TaxID=2593674 RepID=UPI00131BED6A|nr:ABATE domain-containing protein [Saccharothrix deserti]